MTDKEQTGNFAEDLDRLVDRYAKEYDMSYASVIGALQMKVFTLCTDAYDEGDQS
jgi:hypothetical protein